MLDDKIIKQRRSSEIIAATKQEYTKSLLAAASGLHSTESNAVLLAQDRAMCGGPLSLYRLATAAVLSPEGRHVLKLGVEAIFYGSALRFAALIRKTRMTKVMGRNSMMKCSNANSLTSL